jgi:hypothetical protein
MDDGPLAWLQDSPFRSPAWRWRRATWLHERGACADHRDDAWVLRACRHLEVDGGNGGRTRTRPGRCDAPVGAALNLAREGPPHRRWQLEALLLTDEPLADVARRCGLPTATVEAFHELCFHVRPHLACKDWILLQAVGCGPWNAFGGEQPGGWWKYFAFAGGAPILEVVMAVTLGRPLPDWARGSSPRHARAVEAQVRLGFKGLMQTLSARSAAELAALARIAAQARRVTASGTDAPGKLGLMEDCLGMLGARSKRSSRKRCRGRHGLTSQLTDVGRGSTARAPRPDALPQGFGVGPQGGSRR